MLVERTIERPHTQQNGHDAKRKLQNSLHVAEHLPETLPRKQWWKEWLRKSFINQGWERVVVNKQVDSVTMPRWVASAILIAILGFGIQSWWARSSDHDMMIRIEAKLEAAEKAASKAEAEQKATNGDMQAWREVMNGNQKQIIGMLSQQQVDALTRLKKNEQQQQ